jgi:hypothetical protein
MYSRQVATLPMGIEPMIKLFERVKTCHALHRVATVVCRTRVKEPQITVKLYQASLVFLEDNLFII